MMAWMTNSLVTTPFISSRAVQVGLANDLPVNVVGKVVKDALDIG